MPRPYIRVLPEQNNLDICSGAATREVYSSFEQLRLKTIQLFISNSKRLGGYTQWVHFFLQKAHVTKKTYSRHTTSKPHDISEFFLIKNPGILGYSPAKDQRHGGTWPSSYLFQIARGSGATPSWIRFFLQKGTQRSKIPESGTWFHSRKYSDNACFYSARPEWARRGFQSSTMKCSGACRRGTHRIPHKEERRSSLIMIPPM